MWSGYGRGGGCGCGVVMDVNVVRWLCGFGRSIAVVGVVWL